MAFNLQFLCYLQALKRCLKQVVPGIAQRACLPTAQTCIFTNLVLNPVWVCARVFMCVHVLMHVCVCPMEQRC